MAHFDDWCVVAFTEDRAGAARTLKTCARRVQITWLLPARQWTAAMALLARDTCIVQLISTVADCSTQQNVVTLMPNCDDQYACRT